MARLAREAGADSLDGRDTVARFSVIAAVCCAGDEQAQAVRAGSAGGSRWIGWHLTAICHAACSRGGARDIGFCPRRKISMMRMGPPQHGHGSRGVSGDNLGLGF